MLEGMRNDMGLWVRNACGAAEKRREWALRGWRRPPHVSSRPWRESVGPDAGRRGVGWGGHGASPTGECAAAWWALEMVRSSLGSFLTAPAGPAGRCLGREDNLLCREEVAGIMLVS